MRRSNGDVREDLNRLTEFLDAPRTMRELVKAFKRDRKTVFRWLRTLEADGLTVTRVGLSRPTRYMIHRPQPCARGTSDASVAQMG